MRFTGYLIESSSPGEILNDIFYEGTFLESEPRRGTPVVEIIFIPASATDAGIHAARELLENLDAVDSYERVELTDEDAPKDEDFRGLSWVWGDDMIKMLD